MRFNKISLLLVIVFINATFCWGQTDKKKALFVIVDGIPADVIEKVATLNLDAIAKAGGYTRAYVGGQKDTYSQTPTISAVGYNNLLTGTRVNKHDVWDNSIKAPNYHYWTLFRFFADQYPKRRVPFFRPGRTTGPSSLAKVCPQRTRYGWVIRSMVSSWIPFIFRTIKKRMTFIKLTKS